jgi:hypothetical protein
LFNLAARYTTVAVISSVMYPIEAKASRACFGDENTSLTLLGLECLAHEQPKSSWDFGQISFSERIFDRKIREG